MRERFIEVSRFWLNLYRSVKLQTQTLLYNVNTCSHYGISFCDLHQCTLDTTIMWKLKLCIVMCIEWSFVHRHQKIYNHGRRNSQHTTLNLLSTSLLVQC